MWWHYNLGNVKTRPFSAIWSDRSDPIMAGLKRQPRRSAGVAAPVRHFAICGGNTRVRAMRMTGDPWAEDPGCYLDDAEIGLAGAGWIASRVSALRGAAMKRRCPLGASARYWPGRRGPLRAGGAGCRQTVRRALCELPWRRPARRAGPALLPESLGASDRPRAAAVIARAAPRRRCRASARTLDRDEIAALAAYIATPLRFDTSWGEAEIAASRVIHAVRRALRAAALRRRSDEPVRRRRGRRPSRDDPRWRSLRAVARFPTRFALHGGPKFTPDGRYVFFMSRDGWVSKYDLWTLNMLAEVRAGINSRNIAISRDGKQLRSPTTCRIPS